MSIKVIVAGFKGRMGSTAVEMVKGDDELTVCGRKGSGWCSCLHG